MLGIQGAEPVNGQGSESSSLHLARLEVKT